MEIDDSGGRSRKPSAKAAATNSGSDSNTGESVRNRATELEMDAGREKEAEEAEAKKKQKEEAVAATRTVQKVLEESNHASKGKQDVEEDQMITKEDGTRVTPKKEVASQVPPHSKWTVAESKLLIDAVAEFNYKKRTVKSFQGISMTKKWLEEIPKIIANLGGIARTTAGGLCFCPNKNRFDRISGEAKHYLNLQRVEDGPIFDLGKSDQQTGSGMDANGQPDERMAKWIEDDQKRTEKIDIYEYYFQKFPLTATPVS